MNMIRQITKSLRALALAALVLAPAAASAEVKWTEKKNQSISSHKIETDWYEYYWTTTVTVNRGQAHTFRITGLSENTYIDGFEVYCDYTYKDEDGETCEDSVIASYSQDIENASGGYDKYVLLGADDWDWVPETVKSLKFTVKVTGWEKDDDWTAADWKFTFGHADGSDGYPEEEEEEEPEPTVVTPSGAYANPVTVSVADKNTVQSPGSVKWTASEAWETYKDNENYDGYVYLNAVKLTAGRKYVFGFAGLESASVTMTLKGDETDLFSGNESELFSDCEGYCWAVTPETDGDYEIIVYDDSANFTCKFAVFQSRTPAQHEGVTYGDEDPYVGDHFGTLAVGGEGETFVPSYLNDPNSGANDAVIDGKLFKLTGLVKGGSYVFATQGAEVPLLMRLYDANGAVKAENRYASISGNDARIAWTVEDTGTYYLGVCENLEEGDEPSGNEITVTAAAVTVENPSETLSVAATSDDSASPFDVEGAEPSEPRAFSEASWKHTYLIAVRKGVPYRVKAQLTEEGESNGLALKATVKGGTVEEGTETSFDPNEGDSLSFTATANGTATIEVTVADNAEEGYWGDGQGLDYGPYQVCAVAVGEFGTLAVDMIGAPEDEMKWKILKIDGESATGEEWNPAGASLMLPAGDYTLVAKAVTGFGTPSATGFGTFTVTGGETTEATYRYSDTSDPKDDYPAGTIGSVTYRAVSVTPSAKGATVVRTLWSDDRADWFSFTAVAGAYYKFALTETTGYPEVRVYALKSGVKTVTGEDSLEEVAEYVTFDDPADAVQIVAEVKGTYYVRVAHQDGLEDEDSSYTMVATLKNPGVVKFAKTAVTVKDSAGYVDLSVSRTGKEGVTRVDYTTVGEQSSAEDAVYYPTSGTLEWANGDNKAKTIRVRIVPQNAGANKTFQVKLSGCEVEDEENEIQAVFQTTVGKTTVTTSDPICATVTVTPSAKAVPGTIQLADCDTPKKPVVNVVAKDETLTLSFERIGGTDGTVGVKVETVDKTAKAGTDYVKPEAATLTWEAGDAEAQAFSIDLKASKETDYTATKTLTVKLTALSGTGYKDYSKPTLASSTITVNIANDKFTETVAAYATALKKTTPAVAIKEKKSGDWYVASDGSMFAKEGATGTLTFTLTGPGVFTYSKDGVEQESLTVAYGQKTGNTVTINAGEKLDWYEWSPMEDAITLHQCVKYSYEPEDGCVKVAAGKLPDGLKFAQDKTTKIWSISGTPTKAGYFYVKLTDGKKTPNVVEELNFNVVAAGTAIGTFSGLVTTSDTEDGLRSLASVTFTATTAGKLTAKVSVGGKTYSFSDTGYESFDDEDGQTAVTARIPYIQKIGSTKTAETVTNWFTCTIVDAPETDAAARNAEVACTVDFAKLETATKNVYTEDVAYEGRLCRDNSKVADWVTEAAKFAGYYTVSLVNDYAEDGDPKGNGYLTLTFDAKGKVKIAGLLADGTSYSASSVSAWLVEGEDGITGVRVPLYACKKTYVFGGWLTLKAHEEGGTVVVASDEALTWANDDPAATRAGEEGFRLEIVPVGGWYDTVTNLQKWFLDYDMSVDLLGWDYMDLEELLPSGYKTYAFVANPCGQAVDVVGNTVSVEKQALVKDATTKLYDFENSVNPSNVKLTFKRATGVLSGTFDLWYEGYNTTTKKTEQKSLSGLKHNGILLLSREDGILDDEVWTSGYYLVPKAGGTTWTGSYRFDVKATKAWRDWSATAAEE